MASLWTTLREARSEVENPLPRVDGYNRIEEATADTEMQLRIEDIGWTRLNSMGGKDANDLKPADREGIVRRARLYFQQDALCSTGILIYTSYCVGRGLNLVARKKEMGAVKQETDTVIQGLADDFWKHPRNRKTFSIMGQQESSNQLLTDGEIFFALFPPSDDSDVTHIRRLPDCLEVRAILTNPEDYQEIQYYYRTYTPVGGAMKHVLYPDYTMRQLYPEGNYPAPDPQQMKSYGIPSNAITDPTCFVYHAKYRSTGMRGIPMIAPAMGWSKAHKEFLEDRIALNRALARFAWFRKIKGAAASVAKFALNQPNAGPSDMSRLPFNQPAGGIMTTNGAVDWQPVNAQSGGGSAAVESRQLKLQVAVAMGLAEHMLADGGNANRATATVMERQVQLRFQDYQNLWKEAYEAMFAFEMSEQGYEFDPDIVNVTAPAILENDPVSLATAIVQLAQVMPELKVSEFYARALESLNIEDTQDIVPAIEKRAGEIQDQINKMNTLTGRNPTSPGRSSGGISTPSSQAAPNNSAS